METKKLGGFDFWRQTLNSCQYVVAPMVDQSELAWRMLSRKYGAQLCYTPMFHSSVFARNAHYRRESMQTCPEDRPLIFCGNDPDIVLTAAKLAEDHCDAIDLNLGLSKCHAELKIPITCKIRVFESVEKTVQEAVNIPVFANGNIQYLSDVKRCIEETGVEGVMSAEGNLHNPALFANIDPPIWQMCEEYLDLVEKYPCQLSYIRGHIFKILHHGLHLHPDIRDMVGVAKSVEPLRQAVQLMKERGLKEMEDGSIDPRDGIFGQLPLPYWYCQPYVRPSPEEAEENRKKRDLLTRPSTIEVLVAEKGLSKKKVKKRLRNPNKDFDGKKKGLKCNYNLCKGCCRKKTSQEVIDCEALEKRKHAGSAGSNSDRENNTPEDSCDVNSENP
ncbi:DUS1L-like protein, partial [Mya arenaria]